MSDPFILDKEKDFSGVNLPMPAAQHSFMRDSTGDLSFMGLPYRGNIPNLKNDDPDYKQPQYHFDVHIEQFSSLNEEDMKRWTEIMQKISDGLAFTSFEERQYDQDLKGWHILLRWCEPYFQEPDEEPVTPSK